MEATLFLLLEARELTGLETLVEVFEMIEATLPCFSRLNFFASSSKGKTATATGKMIAIILSTRTENEDR